MLEHIALQLRAKLGQAHQSGQAAARSNVPLEDLLCLLITSNVLGAGDAGSLAQESCRS